MTEEIGRIEKPEASKYEGKRKLYMVPVIYTYEGAPADYVDLYTKYWSQVNQQLLNLESKMGTVNVVYHESVTIDGDKGLEIMEKLNPVGCQITKDRIKSDARLEIMEDTDLTEETMDWERHLMMGFISSKVARKVSELFADAAKRRYEYIGNKIDETLKEAETAILFLRENNQVQFPRDIEVFSVAPPALDEIHRWLRERSEMLEAEEASQEESAE